SSVKDRFSNKHEFLYMFSQQQHYYFDLDAVREPHQYLEIEQRRKDFDDKVHYGGQQIDMRGKNRFDRKRSEDFNPLGKNPGDVFEIPSETRTLGAILGTGNAVKTPGGKGWTGHPPGGEHALRKDPRWCPPEGKNPGDFWSIPTQPFPEAHFAVFPEKLVEKPIKAGCPEEICKKCGKARERIVERTGYPDPENNEDDQGRRKSSGDVATDTGRRKVLSGKRHAEFKIQNPDKTIGWTDCGCGVGFEGGVVLDPFCGASTTCYVAKEMGRKYIGIDIKKEYVEMSEKRLA
ncbi:unnamed protein product, partial [marine sediment metagenome]